MIEFELSAKRGILSDRKVLYEGEYSLTRGVCDLVNNAIYWIPLKDSDEERVMIKAFISYIGDDVISGGMMARFAEVVQHTSNKATT